LLQLVEVRLFHRCRILEDALWTVNGPA
jgi:hypothetical protein